MKGSTNSGTHVFVGSCFVPFRTHIAGCALKVVSVGQVYARMMVMPELRRWFQITVGSRWLQPLALGNVTALIPSLEMAARKDLVVQANG